MRWSQRFNVYLNDNPKRSRQLPPVDGQGREKALSQLASTIWRPPRQNSEILYLFAANEVLTGAKGEGLKLFLRLGIGDSYPKRDQKTCSTGSRSNQKGGGSTWAGERMGRTIDLSNLKRPGVNGWSNGTCSNDLRLEASAISQPRCSMTMLQEPNSMATDTLLKRAFSFGSTQTKSATGKSICKLIRAKKR